MGLVLKEGEFDELRLLGVQAAQRRSHRMGVLGVDEKIVGQGRRFGAEIVIKRVKRRRPAPLRVGSQIARDGEDPCRGGCSRGIEKARLAPYRKQGLLRELLSRRRR